MLDFVSLVMEGGILIIIAAVFIWDKVTITKSMVSVLAKLEIHAGLQANALEGLHEATDNTSAALNIIQNTMATLIAAADRNDKRIDYMNNDIRSAIDLLKGRPCMIRFAAKKTADDMEAQGMASERGGADE